MKEYTVAVFGKEGCQKCKVLNKRLDKVLEKDEWKNFEKTYYDVGTIDGLVKYADMEILNPQRIPAFIVLKNTEDGKQVRIKEKFEEGIDEKTGKFRYPTFVSLQTDYRSQGVIRPSDITDVLQAATA